ncbi:MAG TPA: hypothetical protein PLZ36_10670 [Armatimonadota bacterium]|nr:hypothetical protein [Armatimonadota bacterium]HOS42739.1 hypothetical protein [Armatimonadota bacterium]
MRDQKPTLHITDALETVVADLCGRLPAFAHIDPRRLLLCAARARRDGAGGTYARIIPLRFPDGTPFRTHNGQRYALPQIPTEHGDVLYLIYVYLPRFFAQPLERRVLTLIHELYHIAPAFDGTIRKCGARAHGGSRASFNARLEPLVEAYLAGDNIPARDILAADFADLARRYTLIGRALAVPKAVRLPSEPGTAELHSAATGPTRRARLPMP